MLYLSLQLAIYAGQDLDLYLARIYKVYYSWELEEACNEIDSKEIGHTWIFTVRAGILQLLRKGV